MDRLLSPEQSLRMIEGMIAQAKQSFARTSFYFLMWGVLLMAAMVASYLLRERSPELAHGAPWAVAGVLGGIISSVYGSRQGRTTTAVNPMDRIIGWLWGAFVITMLITIFCSVASRSNVNAAVVVITGLPTFLTGQIMRFRPLIVGGVLFWGSGIAMHLIADPLITTLIYCGAMLFGYIIPGLMLKRQEDGLRTA